MSHEVIKATSIKIAFCLFWMHMRIFITALICAMREGALSRTDTPKYFIFLPYSFLLHTCKWNIILYLSCYSDVENMHTCIANIHRIHHYLSYSICFFCHKYHTDDGKQHLEFHLFTSLRKHLVVPVCFGAVWWVAECLGIHIVGDAMCRGCVALGNAVVWAIIQIINVCVCTYACVFEWVSSGEKQKEQKGESERESVSS